MATAWTDIADSQVDPESPGTTTLFTALRDNPIAITEKAAGAPVLANGYVVNAMMATDSVDTTNIIANAVTTAKLAIGEQMTTSNVDGAIAGSSVGAVGTYGLFANSASSAQSPGTTHSGASLQYADAAGNVSGTNPSGTWRLMGYHGTGSGNVSVYLRIS